MVSSVCLQLLVFTKVNGEANLVSVEAKQLPGVTPVFIIPAIVPVSAVLTDENSLGNLAVFETCEHRLVGHRCPCVIARRPVIEETIPAVIDGAGVQDVVAKIGWLT